MDINTLMAYLNKTPENTNPAIVKSIVEDIINGEKPTAVWAFTQDMWNSACFIGSERVIPFYDDADTNKCYELPANTEIELVVPDISESYGVLLINKVEQSVYDKTESAQIYKVKLTENSFIEYTSGNSEI